MTYQFANNAAATLASSISDSATSITVATGKGALFPTPSGAAVFQATIVRASDSAVEIVTVAARSGDVMTVTRAQEGTAGLTCVAGDKFELRLTKAVMESLATDTEKQATLVSGTNIKSVNGTTLLGSGDLEVAGLAGNTFTGAQVYSDQLVSRAMHKDCGLTVVDKGNSGTSTQTYDYTAGSVQTSTATGNHTIAFSNFPPTGNLGMLHVILTNGGAYTITWPTITWIEPDGTTTTSISTYLAANTGRTSLKSSGVDQFAFWSRDAGTTVYGKLI